MRKLIFLVLTLTFMPACHTANKQYRLGDASVVTVPPELKPSVPLSTRPVESVGCDPSKAACLAFLEFDDLGEMYDLNQIDRARDLIRRSLATDKQSVILTFVHGWKHNAGQDDENVRGFEYVLNEVRNNVYPNHNVIGIFIGWRGELVSKYWPVRRQLSYFNREAAAIRIPSTSLSSALHEIVIAAHEGDSESNAILIGHSFGGLMLERAVTQMTAAAVDGPSMNSAVQKLPRELADLVVFVNSAAAATEAKQMLDLLALRPFTYQSDYIPSPSGNGCGTGGPQPMFVSISSSGDMATRFAMPIGHGPSFLGFKTKGSLRSKDPMYCANAKASGKKSGCTEDVPSQGAFYMSTAAHMELLQSHLVLRGDSKDVPPGAHARCFTLPDTHEMFKIVERPNRWNDTPYWIMQVDPAVIPDHGTIFTQRFIHMVSAFLLSRSQMEDTKRRPVLMR